MIPIFPFVIQLLQGFVLGLGIGLGLGVGFKLVRKYVLDVQFKDQKDVK